MGRIIENMKEWWILYLMLMVFLSLPMLIFIFVDTEKDVTKKDYDSGVNIYCVDGVEYVSLYQTALTPKYNLDGSLSPCILENE